MFTVEEQEMWIVFCLVCKIPFCFVESFISCGKAFCFAKKFFGALVVKSILSHKQKIYMVLVQWTEKNAVEKNQ